MSLVVWCLLCAATAQNIRSYLPTGVASDVMELVWGSPASSNTPALYRNRLNLQRPVVDTTHGQVRGFHTLTSRDRKKYSAFVGIPYATPPTGDRRFTDPVDAEPWQEVRDAGFERPTCFNFLKPSQGSEDCLYLNVFTPDATSESLRPVMAFIHGGAFLGGSSNTSLYSPDYLIERNVVLTTFNYRLGPLGFLSLQDAEVPGNAGLKDQALAMRWVRRNIRSFGGDPNRITIFGESAGAASVHYHVISRSSADLFDQAILQSGTVLSPWAYTPPHLALRKAFVLGERVGCMSAVGPSPSRSALLMCLRATPPPLLVNAQLESLTLEEIICLRPFAFLPTTEPNGKGAFLTKSPSEHMEAGDFNKVPIMMGSNSAEGLMILPALKKYDPAGMLVTFLGQDLERLIPQTIRNTMTSGQSSQIVSRMKEFYFQNQPPTILSRRRALDLLTDVQFLWQIQQAALLMSQRSSAPVYNYYFTYDSRYAMFKTTTGITEEPGVCHADELGSLFETSNLAHLYNGHKDRSSPEEKAIDRVTTLWTDFARTGSPTPGKAGPEEWKPFSPAEYNYYEIGIKNRPEKAVQQEHIRFWNDAFQLVTGTRYFSD